MASNRRPLSNCADLHFDKFLAMARAALAVFTTAKFLYRQFLAFGVSDDFSGHGRTFNIGRSQLKTGIGRNGQNPIESDFVARVEVAVINFQRLSRFDFVLVGTVSNNRVHKIES